MTADEWVATRRELLDAATEGPWEVRVWNGEHAVYTPNWPGTVAELGTGNHDAALIADARTSLPAALDALESALALADNPYPDARNISGADIKRAIEAALRGEL